MSASATGRTRNLQETIFKINIMSNRHVALNLYRSILKAHKKHLPTEMKQLGDAYVKSEFRLHKSVTETKILDQFYESWDEYLNHILKTSRTKETKISTDVLSSSSPPSSTTSEESLVNVVNFGKDLPTNLDLSDEQIKQLQNLRQEASKVK